MSVNYNQSCILGICLECENLLKVTQPEKSEMQNRYDPKTGVVTHQEKVIIKQEESIYVFGEHKAWYIYDLGYSITKNNDLDFVADEEQNLLYIGYKIGETTDFGRADLLEGSFTFNDLYKLVQKLDIQYDFIEADDVEIHFVTHVG